MKTVKTVNKAVQIRRRLLTALADTVLKDEFPGKLDTLPVVLYPRTNNSHRCCVYKDRAITRDRILAVLGYDPQNCNDSISLKEYSANIPPVEKDDPAVTVIPEACSTCLKSRYIITNGCRGCLARHCQNNCPRDAITFMNGKAVIDEEKCINCGICMKSCPFNAVIYMPLPCEEACPVKAVEKDKEGRIQINKERCISCGKCYTACPFGAVMIRSHMIPVLQKLMDPDVHVTALPAPSLGGQFPEEWPFILQALMDLGFNSIREVAEGALMTTEKEAEELLEKMEEKDPIMTTSCCPGYIQWAEKHCREVLPYVSKTPSPMQFTGRIEKRENPDSVTVFISPCPAKKMEALRDENIDYVLSFEELGTLFIAAGIEITECMVQDPEAIVELDTVRKFSYSSGVTASVLERIPEDLHPRTLVINGLDKKSSPLIKSRLKKSDEFTFIEVMCCQEGCIGGPEVLNIPQKAKKRIQNWVQSE